MEFGMDVTLLGAVPKTCFLISAVCNDNALDALVYGIRGRSSATNDSITRVAICLWPNELLVLPSVNSHVNYMISHPQDVA
jgi:hypothetical protein